MMTGRFWYMELAICGALAYFRRNTKPATQDDPNRQFRFCVFLAIPASRIIERECEVSDIPRRSHPIFALDSCVSLLCAVKGIGLIMSPKMMVAEHGAQGALETVALDRRISHYPV